MSEPNKWTAPLIGVPEPVPPPTSIQPAPKRRPWTTMSTKLSISTATKRIQKPAGRVVGDIRTTPGAGVVRGGRGNDAGGAAGGGPPPGAAPAEARRPCPL